MKLKLNGTIKKAYVLFFVQSDTEKYKKNILIKNMNKTVFTRTEAI